MPDFDILIKTLDFVMYKVQVKYILSHFYEFLVKTLFLSYEFLEKNFSRTDFIRKMPCLVSYFNFLESPQLVLQDK